MEIVHVINGKEYVLVKVPLGNDASVKQFTEAAHDHNGIIQDWEVMLKGIFFSHKVKVSVLIPSENIEKFNEQLYK